MGHSRHARLALQPSSNRHARARCAARVHTGKGATTWPNRPNKGPWPKRGPRAPRLARVGPRSPGLPTNLLGWATQPWVAHKSPGLDHAAPGCPQIARVGPRSPELPTNLLGWATQPWVAHKSPGLGHAAPGCPRTLVAVRGMLRMRRSSADIFSSTLLPCVYMRCCAQVRVHV